MEPRYPIIEVFPEWVIEKEAMGSKQKFWYRPSPDSPPSLFKFPQASTGQHWAEKIAAQVAAQMEITHAAVELASFQGTPGSASRSVAGEAGHRSGAQPFGRNLTLPCSKPEKNQKKRLSTQLSQSSCLCVLYAFGQPAAVRCKTARYEIRKPRRLRHLAINASIHHRDG